MRPYDRLLATISLSRVAIAAVIIVVFDPNSQFLAAVCCGLYVLGHLTDHLDGYIARKFSYPDDKGFMLDSVSDKLFQIGSLIPLHLYYDLSIVLFWLVLVREFFVVALFSFVNFSDDKTVRFVSRYSYIFVGLIRLTTVVYLTLPIVREMLLPETIEHIRTIGFVCYVGAIAISMITIFDMYKASNRGSSDELVRRSQNGEDPNT